MKVKIITIDQATGDELIGAPCWLEDCFPEMGPDYESARDELVRTGRVWIGGGAAPLVMLQRVV